jgi:type I restriction enzyme S subunit
VSAADLVRIGEISEQIRGVSYGKSDAIYSAEDGYIPILRAGNITDTGVAFDDLVFVPEARIAAKQLLRAGDVLIAASSGSLDVVGKAAPVLADYLGAFGAFCKVLRPTSERVDASYFAHYFRTPAYRRAVSGLAAGANINNLRNEHLDDLLVPLPPLPEQRRIAAILNKADALRVKRRDALAQLDRLAQSIFVEMFGDPVTNPKVWPKVQMQDLCESPDDIKCGPFGTQLAKSEFKDEGVPLWGIKNVNAQFRLPAFEFLAEDTAKRLVGYGLTAGDIVMTRKGTVGNCAVYPKALPDGVMHSDLLRIRVSPKKCHRRLKTDPLSPK